MKSSFTKEARDHRLKPAKYAAYDEKGFPVQLAAYSRNDDCVGTLEIFNGSMVFTAKKPLKRVPESARESKRGLVQGQSRKSSNRLKRELVKVMRPDQPYMLTLTQSECVTYSKVFKKQLHHFKVLFMRRYPWLLVFWKLEFQQRGAAHFHLLIWYAWDINDGFRSEDEEWIADAWCRVVDGGHDVYEYGAQLISPYGLQYTEKFKSYMIAVNNAAEGHHLKQDQIRDNIHTGRYWGIWNKDAMNACKDTVKLSFSQMVKLRRIFRKIHLANAKKRGIAHTKNTKNFTRYLRKQNQDSFTFFIHDWHTMQLYPFLGIDYKDVRCGF